MDADRFESLLRSFTTSPSRRGAVRVLVGSALAGSLGWFRSDETHAANKKGKGGGNKQKGGVKGKKGKGKKKPRGEACGSATCARGSFCCDDARGICCSSGSTCCNVGPGTGSCCPAPNRCGKPWGNDNASFECCPPERQWFTYTGIVRCCPSGTRSLGTGITSDDGPCCPEEKYCSQALTGGTCCPDLAPICVSRASGICCAEADMCGTDCCGGGRVCCNEKCCPFQQICDGGTCKCPSGVRQCEDTCCHAAAVACDGSRCLNQCDIDGDCGG